MAGLLGDIYSYGDTLKRKVNGLLADPRGTLEQFVGQLGDQANQTSDLMNQAGWMPIANVKSTPQQQALARSLLADYGAQSGMAGMINPADLGLPVNKNGTVSLFHGTTQQGADDIVKNRVLRSNGEPNVYLTTAKDAGYGDGTLVQVDVHPRHLNLDDEFPSGRMDFSMDAPNKIARILAAKIVK